MVFNVKDEDECIFIDDTEFFTFMDEVRMDFIHQVSQEQDIPYYAGYSTTNMHYAACITGHLLLIIMCDRNKKTFIYIVYNFNDQKFTLDFGLAYISSFVNEVIMGYQLLRQ